MDYHNNYVGNSSMINNTRKNSDILIINLNTLHNYFDGPTGLYSAKFSDTLAKFFRFKNSIKLSTTQINKNNNNNIIHR